MMNAMTEGTLKRENRTYLGSGACSEENRSVGFRPAFMDAETGAVYASCFADGRPAPCHLLDGLPDEVVLERYVHGGVKAVKHSVMSGFIYDRRFFTREEAASWLARHALH